jgi:basic amino acid/polyamine antiporter, APA family
VATAPKSETRKGLFATKPINVLVAETEEKETQLKRAVGALDLTALGLGAIIGTGIFVIIGEAITTSGPSIVLAFMIAGVTCIFSALAFAELASAIPVSGSAYTYSYATLGELAAWIIGWDLILEYGVSIAAVAVGWGAYLNELLDSLLGLSLPDSIANPPGEEGGKVNIPAAFLVLAVTAVLMIGVRESARTNTIMVFFKLAVLLLFLVLGVTAFNSDNFSPFFVEGEGISGTITAATLIFFAYIGFDAVSTSSEEVKEPKRDLPRAIIGSLLIATTLYILVALVATGALPFDQLKGQDAPLAEALSEGAGMEWAAEIISFGALVAITSVVLTLLYGQSRILFAMSRDGLLPRRISLVNPRTRTPVMIIGICGVAFAALAAAVPLKEIVELVNIGTLFAFVVVNLGVIILRRTRPDLPRGYRVPLVPWFPIVGTLFCVYLMYKLPGTTWVRFFIWMALGVAIYFLYGIRNSRLRKGEVVNPEAELPAS